MKLNFYVQAHFSWSHLIFKMTEKSISMIFDLHSIETKQFLDTDENCIKNILRQQLEEK